MKIKLKDIFQLQSGLDEIAKKDVEDDTLNYRLIKLHRKRTQVLEDYDKARQEAFKRFSRVGDDGKREIQEASDAAFSYQDILRDLLEEEEEIPWIPIPLSQVKTLKLTSGAKCKLWPLWADEEPGEAKP